ncbi:hypothetical protein [Pseudescherichia sp.]|uniref:endonuclease/exonuclease/phosphatase family protein n=1 Tax=Pseudescherichia sp. TaxID=2055881 RepID=UPI002898D24B|nr:hypothetical protein [Pseudescherichia sp.]
MKIAFWNIGLTHKKDIPDYKASVNEAIFNLMTENNHDIVFVCEVDEEFISNRESIDLFERSNITILPAMEKFNRNLKFDICALFKNSSFSLNLNKYIKYNDLEDENQNTGNNTKVGVEFIMKNCETDEEELSLIISHWPSKISLGYEFKHKDAAEELRRECNSIIKSGKQLILMGDYNKTPEEITKETNLKSYNNKYYALRSNSRLYNLAFSFFGQHSLIATSTMQRNHNNRGFGTFLSSSKRHAENGCSVLDHAHVSSSFIEDGPWVLNESETKVFFNDKILELVYGDDNHLDHLPISIEVNKNE